MAEDYEKMKAQKVSKTETLKKIISSNSNSSSGSAKKSGTSKSSSGKSTSKSNSQRRKTNSGNNSVTGLISEIVSASTSQPKKRGRPKKSSSTTSTASQKSQNKSSSTKPNENNEEPITPQKNAKYMSKTQKKAFKREGKSLILFICFLVVGVFVGYAVTRFFVFPLAFPNDTYEMVEFESGGKTSADIYINKNADESEIFTFTTYTELGVKCIAFGKDYSADYTVTYYYRNDLTQDEEKLNGIEDIDPSKEGIYYAVYSVPALKYKTVTLIRNIIVLRGEDDE